VVVLSLGERRVPQRDGKESARTAGSESVRRVGSCQGPRHGACLTRVAGSGSSARAPLRSADLRAVPRPPSTRRGITQRDDHRSPTHDPGGDAALHHRRCSRLTRGGPHQCPTGPGGRVTLSRSPQCGAARSGPAAVASASSFRTRSASTGSTGWTGQNAERQRPQSIGQREQSVGKEVATPYAGAWWWTLSGVDRDGTIKLVGAIVRGTPSLPRAACIGHHALLRRGSRSPDRLGNHHTPPPHRLHPTSNHRPRPQPTPQPTSLLANKTTRAPQ
jgi:hypothetical protein